jgi:hypothetical protein
MKTLALKTNIWLLSHECGCSSSLIVEAAMDDSDRRRFQNKAKKDGLTLTKPRVGETITMECDDPTCIGRAIRKVNAAKTKREHAS